MMKLVTSPETTPIIGPRFLQVRGPSTSTTTDGPSAKEDRVSGTKSSQLSDLSSEVFKLPSSQQHHQVATMQYPNDHDQEETAVFVEPKNRSSLGLFTSAIANMAGFPLSSPKPFQPLSPIINNSNGKKCKEVPAADSLALPVVIKPDSSMPLDQEEDEKDDEEEVPDAKPEENAGLGGSLHETLASAALLKSPTMRSGRHRRYSAESSRRVRSHSLQPSGSRGSNSKKSSSSTDEVTSNRRAQKKRSSVGDRQKRKKRTPRHCKSADGALDSSNDDSSNRRAAKEDSTRSTSTPPTSRKSHGTSSGDKRPSETTKRKAPRRCNSVQLPPPPERDGSDKGRASRKTMRRAESTRCTEDANESPRTRASRKKPSGREGRKTRNPPRHSQSQEGGEEKTPEQTLRKTKSHSPRRPTSVPPRKRSSGGAGSSRPVSRTSTGTKAGAAVPNTPQPSVPMSHQVQKVLQKEVQQALNESNFDLAKDVADADDVANKQAPEPTMPKPLSSAAVVDQSTGPIALPSHSKQKTENDDTTGNPDSPKQRTGKANKLRRRRHISTRTISQ